VGVKEKRYSIGENRYSGSGSGKIVLISLGHNDLGDCNLERWIKCENMVSN
jgi:hypothetical protein